MIVNKQNFKKCIPHKRKKNKNIEEEEKSNIR